MCLAVTIIASFATSAQALVININPVAGGGLSGTSALALQVLGAFNRAADKWEAKFTDNVTIQINANYRNLGASNVIGRASSTMLQFSYDTIRNAMVNDAKNESDDGVVAFLPTSAQYNSLLPAGITRNGNIMLSQANALALGFSRVTASDATIEFNSTFSFDFDNTNGVAGTDFETVALHEIGHALGFLSVVDQVDKMVANGQTGSVAVRPLDLFRFGATQNPSTAALFTSMAHELRPGQVAYLDDLTSEYRMSTGVARGDGRQASHWRDNSLSGILLGAMDPTLPNGTIMPITAADIQAFDLIGWDDVGSGSVSPAAGAVTSSSQTSSLSQSDDVPEPGAIMLLLSGLGLMGLLQWRSANHFAVRSISS